eukprot:403357995
MQAHDSIENLQFQKLHNEQPLRQAIEASRFLKLTEIKNERGKYDSKQKTQNRNQGQLKLMKVSSAMMFDNQQMLNTNTITSSLNISTTHHVGSNQFMSPQNCLVSQPTTISTNLLTPQSAFHPQQNKHHISTNISLLLQSQQTQDKNMTTGGSTSLMMLSKKQDTFQQNHSGASINTRFQQKLQQKNQSEFNVILTKQRINFKQIKLDEKVVQQGLQDNFRTSYRHPSEKIRAMQNQNHQRFLSSSSKMMEQQNNQRPFSASNTKFAQTTKNFNEDIIKEDSIEFREQLQQQQRKSKQQNRPFSASNFQKKKRYSTTNLQESSFHSFHYAIDEQEYKDLQQDQEKRQLLEERYKPRKYFNVELKPPTPTFDPSKIFKSNEQHPLTQNNTLKQDQIGNTIITQKSIKVRRLQSAKPTLNKFQSMKSLKPQNSLETQNTQKLIEQKYEKNQQNYQNEQPLHLIAIQKNRSNLLDILTSEEMKEVRLKLTEDQVNKLKRKTFEQVKEVYLKDQQQSRLKQYKKVLLSRKACDQVAFELRFLPKKQRERLQHKLRWYVANNVNMDIEIDKGNKVDCKFDQEIDDYFKENFGNL